MKLDGLPHEFDLLAFHSNRKIRRQLLFFELLKHQKEQVPRLGFVQRSDLAFDAADRDSEVTRHSRPSVCSLKAQGMRLTDRSSLIC